MSALLVFLLLKAGSGSAMPMWSAYGDELLLHSHPPAPFCVTETETHTRGPGNNIIPHVSDADVVPAPGDFLWHHYKNPFVARFTSQWYPQLDDAFTFQRASTLHEPYKGYRYPTQILHQYTAQSGQDMCKSHVGPYTSQEGVGAMEKLVASPSAPSSSTGDHENSMMFLTPPLHTGVDTIWPVHPIHHSQIHSQFHLQEKHNELQSYGKLHAQQKDFGFSESPFRTNEGQNIRGIEMDATLSHSSAEDKRVHHGAFYLHNAYPFIPLYQGDHSAVHSMNRNQDQSVLTAHHLKKSSILASSALENHLSTLNKDPPMHKDKITQGYHQPTRVPQVSGRNLGSTAHSHSHPDDIHADDKNLKSRVRPLHEFLNDIPAWKKQKKTPLKLIEAADVKKKYDSAAICMQAFLNKRML